MINLQTLWNQLAQSPQAVTFSDSLLQTGGTMVQDLLNDLEITGALSIAAPHLSAVPSAQAPQSITAAGTMTLPGTSVPVQATLTFVQPGSGIDFTLVITLPQAWQLSSLFSDLDALDFLSFQNASLILTSYVHDLTQPVALSAVRGLSFAAKVPLIAAFPVLTVFTSPPGLVQLSGSIGTSHEISFVATLPFTMDLGVPTISLAQPSLHIDRQAGATPTFRVCAELALGAARFTIGTTLPVGAPSPPPDLSSASLVTLGDLGALFGATDTSWLGTLPGPVAALAQFGIKDFSIAFDPTSKHLTEIGLQVGMSQDWNIVPGSFAIKNLLIGWTITWTPPGDPSGAWTRQIGLPRVSGTMQLGSFTATLQMLDAIPTADAGPGLGAAMLPAPPAIADGDPSPSVTLPWLPSPSSQPAPPTLPATSELIVIGSLANLSVPIGKLITGLALPGVPSTFFDGVSLSWLDISVNSAFFYLLPAQRWFQATVVLDDSASGTPHDLVVGGITLFRLLGISVSAGVCVPRGGTAYAVGGLTGTAQFGTSSGLQFGFRAALDTRPSPKAFSFDFFQLPGTSIDLLSLLTIFGVTALPSNVPNLGVSNLALSHNTYTGAYSVSGQTTAWTWGPLSANASFSLSKADQNAALEIALTATVVIGGSHFAAQWQRQNGQDKVALYWEDLEITYDAQTKTVTLVGVHILTAIDKMVNLVDPNFAFSLDPPWSGWLDRPENISLTIDQVQHKVAVSIAGASGALIDLSPLGTINSIGVSYQRGLPLAMQVQTSLGSLSWDPVTHPAPSSLGGGTTPSKVLSVNYLGVGQHVALTNTSGIQTVSDAISALSGVADISQQPDPKHVSGLAYDAGSGWLVGLNLNLLGAIQLAVIFNDPQLYGLHIGLSGDKIKPLAKLAGLSFDILYRKISDTLGVYHVDLLVPELLRHLEFGEFSITLPHFLIDVYTDGTFLVDMGFPHNLDFSQSLTFEVIILGVPVLGAAGLYFGYLDAQVVPAVPKVKNGEFSPVLVFGFGLQLGIGKSFDEGPLSAGVLVSIQGIVEGVYAQFHAATNSGASDDYFFSLSGTISISAHVWGTIDFSIVSASLDLYVFAAVHAVFEIYQPLLLQISAGVSVSLSVTVCGFIHIHVSFSTTITESIEIPTGGSPQWQLA